MRQPSDGRVGASAQESQPKKRHNPPDKKARVYSLAPQGSASPRQPTTDRPRTSKMQAQLYTDGSRGAATSALATTATGPSINDLPAELFDMILGLVGVLPPVRMVCRSWQHRLDYLVDTRRCRRLLPQQYIALLGRWNLKEMIIWARAHGCPWDAKACTEAALAGHLDLLQWLLAGGCLYDQRLWPLGSGRWHLTAQAKALDCPNFMWHDALYRGRTDIAQWVLASGHVWPKDACDSAAAGGQIATLSMARDAGCAWSAKTCAKAARGGHLETLQWLRANQCPWDEDTPRYAIGARQFDVAEWAIERGCPVSLTIILRAMDSGSIRLVQLLRRLGHEWSCSARHAARKGHLNLLKWAITDGCPLDGTVCDEAAAGGHLEVLQWLRAEGCPWGARTCGAAADEGHLDVIEWAVANGCPWDRLMCSWVAGRGRLDILQWAVARGCPWDEWTCSNAAASGHLNVLEWARTNGCPWNKETCISAAKGGHLDVLKWARANGCPWDRAACLASAARHRPEVRAWILTQPKK
ncbi:ankyrin repeat domain containing protein [Pandoravirus celtis]|uniref:Ankyrin repeat domain containing protein n=1 Tax=Pandoravirus celtis TaxID=2568002 RepID=A0A4D6EHS3_9VIRU|nr:ankyrin repeat domain containing protein [Pandoravirus celtis]